MSREFMAGIPGQVGGFARQVPGRLENAAGLGLDLYSTLNALSSHDPTALLRLQLLQSQAAQDPGVRSQLGSGGSPFFSGLLGLPVHSQQQAGPVQPGAAPLPTVLAPRLPPLSAERQAEVDEGRRALELAQQPGTRFSLPYPGGGTVASPPLPPPSRFDLRPGETLQTDASTGGVFAVGGPTPRYLYKAPTDPRVRAEAQAEVPAKPTFRDVVAMRAAGVDPGTGSRLPPLARRTAKRELHALERARFGQAEAGAAGGVSGRPLAASAQTRLVDIECIRALTGRLREILKDPAVRADRGVLEGRLRKELFNLGLSQGTLEDQFQALQSFIAIAGAQPFLRGVRRLEWVTQVQRHLPNGGESIELLEDKLNNLDYWTGTFAEVITTLARTPSGQLDQALERLTPEAFAARAPGYRTGGKEPPKAILQMEVH